MKWVTILLSAMIMVSACSNNNNTEANSNGAVQQSTELSAIQTETTKLQEETTKLQAAITAGNVDDVKSVGKSIHNIWLGFENAVRQTFPLQYTEVEKYELPIFSASAYDKIDLEALAITADNLQHALTVLYNAKVSNSSTSELLAQAVANYKLYVDEQAANLVSSTQTFVDAVKAGDMEAAKAGYTKARVYFENIEPIAESFGDLDPRIDARLADVEDEAEWTGFHRIERALWETQSLDGMEQYADQLIADTQELQKQIQSLELEPSAMVAGAMELLNEAAISKITGEEEIYSHTDLVDFAANVDGSKQVYLAIIPALNEKNVDLADQLDQQFQTLEATLRTHQTDGQYVSYDQLTTEEIRTISDQISQLSNLMSQTATIL